VADIRDRVAVSIGMPCSLAIFPKA